LPAGEELDLPVAGSFSALGPGRPGLVVDSYGLLALCLDRSSAAAAYGLAPGRRLRLRPGSVRPRD
ncbi:MAG TPA: SAM hydroxide adenosyltransferase, partial [Acidimicrobiales bacterium]|nr:SAM hydroxide adenosyltransferase [Acidimicrobiales bacterium]